MGGGAADHRRIRLFGCDNVDPVSCSGCLCGARPGGYPVTMETMHRRLAGSEFEVLPDAWHMSVFTDLDRLVDLLNR